MKTIDCIICDGKASLHIEKKTKKFRTEDFFINEHFYKCEKCGEEFTTTEIDQLNIVQVYNQYREKFHIPFPEEIISTREQYGLSAAKMSEVLGFGINTYRNYENGEIPSIANAKLISLAGDPSTFKSIIENNGKTLKTKELEELFFTIESLIEKSRRFLPIVYINFSNNVPNEFTGYKKPDIEKIKNLVLYFLRNTQREYADKLKLNKLLFYSDFLSFSKNGNSISGIEYRALHYGPVPSNYDIIFSILEQDEIIEKKFEQILNKKTYELFEPVKPYNENMFNEVEMRIISLVTEKFKNISSWDLVDISHKEKAWIELNEQRDIISYQKYGFELAGI